VKTYIFCSDTFFLIIEQAKNNNIGRRILSAYIIYKLKGLQSYVAQVVMFARFLKIL
jgi:hypothetical protein